MSTNRVVGEAYAAGVVVAREHDRLLVAAFFIARLGAVEEWTIRNTHEHDDHMFHIHTNPFQLIEVSGQPQSDRLWRDTVVVPRPAKGGSVVIRSRFLDYTGVLMMHCHMMNHEEMGMMQTVEVYKD